MVGSYKRIIIQSLLRKNSVAKICNLARHAITYPQSRYVLTGGINIIHRCNLDCEFCNYGLGDRMVRMPDMDEQTFDRCLNISAYKYILIISIGCGEPFLHKDIFKFIRKVHNHGALVSMGTNTTLFSQRLDELLATPPDLIWFSHYDKYEKMQSQNIELFVRRRPKNVVLGLSKLIGKNNLSDMQKILELADSLKIENVWFQQFYPDGFSSSDISLKDRIIFDSDRESIGHIEETKRLLKRKYKTINCTFPNPIRTVNAKHFCPFLYKGFGLEPNGAIQPCCFIHPMGKDDYGNIFKDEHAHMRNERYLLLKQNLSMTDKELPDACKYCYGVNFG